MKVRKTIMSKKQKFIDAIEDAFFSKVDINELDPDVVDYWNALKGASDTEKPMFTDNGKLVMEYLKGLPEGSPSMKAKDIAEALFVSSRTVSGAMRKLVTDGFVEKIGQDPVMYSITEKGKNIELN
jgi:DNA-binding MarR family transcriptional regulator